MSHGGLFKTFAVAAVLAIMVVNALLINQNRILKERVDLSIHGELQPGDEFPSFGGVNLDGLFVDVSLKERAEPTLVISFSTGCTACMASLSHWQNLMARLTQTPWKILWLSRDPRRMTVEFSHTNRLDGEILTEFSCSTVNALGLRSVPTLLAVSSDGIIERMWHGELTEQGWKEVVGFFEQNPDEPKPAAVAAAPVG